MDITLLGNVAVAVDSQGQLYLYRLLPISEPGMYEAVCLYFYFLLLLKHFLIHLVLISIVVFLYL